MTYKPSTHNLSQLDDKNKTIVISQQNNRRRVQYNCSEPLITDQSGAKEADINNIMSQYTKHGMLPQTSNLGEYLDNSNLPSLEQAYDIVRNATDAFLTLPPVIRKLMDNDPSQLENFISDANNRDLLVKHGILTPPQKEVPVSTLTKPTTTEPVVITEKTKKTE